MHDWDISLTAVLATIGWVVGVLLVVVNVFVDLDIGPLGVVVVAGAATMNVRGFFCRQAERERNAFRLGREYEGGRVRPVK